MGQLYFVHKDDLEKYEEYRLKLDNIYDKIVEEIALLTRDSSEDYFKAEWVIHQKYQDQLNTVDAEFSGLRLVSTFKKRDDKTRYVPFYRDSVRLGKRIT